MLDLGEVLKCSQCRDLRRNYSKLILSSLSPFGRIISLDTDFSFPLFECFFILQ